jgi:hypothetical protein
MKEYRIHLPIFIRTSAVDLSEMWFRVEERKGRVSLSDLTNV